jgi:hypothetical protein
VALEGEVVDAESGKLLPSRLYVEGPPGTWHHVESAAAGGSAVRYAKERFRSVEVHTTLSAHPFRAALAPGRYTLLAERGKEYFPAQAEVTLAAGADGAAGAGAPARVTLKLRRFIDMAALGWYSGETHVHRALADLPNLLLAEDLNVAFPLLYWVTRAFEAPAGGEAARKKSGATLIEVDSTHVIWPRNTEWEIFTVGEKRHELGAFFAIGHRSVFDAGVPPLSPVAERARAEGALIELDKHAWPWSMCLVPLLDVDLYELANNHLWRTEFGFRAWGAPPPDYMRVERDAGGLTERGWIDYGLKCYYALLDSGFRLRPTAGTASGVHPVPLGFGRVYVELDGPFRYERWLEGLDAGRSFVTTGPMLFVLVNGRPPGHRFERAAPADDPGAAVEPFDCEVHVRTVSETPITQLELVLNGEVTASIGASAASTRTEAGAWECDLSFRQRVSGTSWLAVRAFEERPGGRVRFAHSSPVWVDVAGRPLRPRKEEAAFLVARVEEEIARSEGVLPAAAIAEYRRALDVYRRIAENAR